MTGQVVLVTEGGARIVRAAVELFAERGGAVVVADVTSW